MHNLYFQKHFLVAMPNMNDPRFNEAVILIAEHNANGAMGMVINKPTPQTFNHFCLRMGTKNKNTKNGDEPIYYGGPVQPERGMVLHQPLGSWASTLNIDEQTGLTHSRDIFECLYKETPEDAMVKCDNDNDINTLPDNAMLALGCASWSAGQLEQEIIANIWLAVPFSHDLDFIFNTPSDKHRDTVLSIMGISMAHMVQTVGHG